MQNSQGILVIRQYKLSIRGILTAYCPLPTACFLEIQ